MRHTAFKLGSAYLERYCLLIAFTAYLEVLPSVCTDPSCQLSAVQCSWVSTVRSDSPEAMPKMAFHATVYWCSTRLRLTNDFVMEPLNGQGDTPAHFLVLPL